MQPMGIRVSRRGTTFTLTLDRPNWVKRLSGVKAPVKRGGFKTEAEAKAAALRFEAEKLAEWEALKRNDPIEQAAAESRSTGLDLDEVLADQMQRAGWSREKRDAVMLALLAEPEELAKQGLPAPVLERETEAALRGTQEGQRAWQEWIKDRTLLEDRANSTVTNWETKLKGLAVWYGSDRLGTMTRKDANAYKLHLMKDRGFQSNSVSNYIGTFSGMWNYLITSGELETENIWTGLKKGLPAPKAREAMDAELLRKAEQKADRMEDVRFWFGRYQGLRKEDYCGLRWCDIDMQEGVIHLKQYTWKGQERRLKLKERGVRTVPMHSKLIDKINKYLPEAITRNDEEPIWPDDYKHKLNNWGARFAERFKDRYGFGSHDLRSYVVTRMMQLNINPFYLEVITGHSVPGNKVVGAYVAPTMEQVREVLELMD